MTVARSQIIDLSITSWYHVISKTVRGAFLLSKDGEEDFDRKQWIEDRLKLLREVFALEIGGFSILDNHLHLLVNLLPDQIEDWSDEEVLRRWFKIHPPRVNRKVVDVTDDLVRKRTKDTDFVKAIRRRLGNMGWFMKSLKEPIARLANLADGTTGAFWQSRYKSVAILDNEALLAVDIYIDLNVQAAGITKLPEESPHTSIRARVEHCRAHGRMEDLQAARHSSALGAVALSGLEDESLWLCPIEDRRQQDPTARPGLLDGFSLGSYLQLVDWTSRLVRWGKTPVSQGAEALLDRLEIDVERWSATMTKLLTTTRHQGVAFAFNRARLHEAAERRGCRHLANLNGCPA